MDNPETIPYIQMSLKRYVLVFILICVITLVSLSIYSIPFDIMKQIIPFIVIIGSAWWLGGFVIVRIFSNRFNLEDKNKILIIGFFIIVYGGLIALQSFFINRVL